MNLLDFFYLRDELLPPEKAQPTAKNTILRNEKEAGIAKFSSAADIDWLDSYMTKIQDEPIAYLGAPKVVLIFAIFAGRVTP